LSKVTLEDISRMVRSDPKVMKFLTYLIEEHVSRIIPRFDHVHGARYPDVEKLFPKESPTLIQQFLTKLANMGILIPIVHDKVIVCPFCGSYDINTHYCCPLCETYNIVRTILIEHILCGYIGTYEEFRRGDRLVCPRCKRQLFKPNADYRALGTFFKCENCGYRFDEPVIVHACRRCGKNFTYKEAIYTAIYAYDVNSEMKEELAKGLLLTTALKSILENEGFRVEAPAKVEGSSGTIHEFDIGARYYYGKDKSLFLVVEVVASEDEIDDRPVVRLFAKCYDTRPDVAILIAIPSLSDHARALCKLYKIMSIEASSIGGSIKKFQDLIRKIKESTSQRA